VISKFKPMLRSINIIVAIAKNGIIGKNNELLWKLSADLKYFSKLTTGKTVVMGRNTFFSIFKMLGKPLPNRRNIVLSETKDGLTNVEIFDSWEKVLNLSKTEELFIIGGANVYKQALPHTNKLYITEVDCSPEGDVSFPDFDKNNWILLSEEPHLKDDKNEYNYNFKIYQKK